MATDSTRERHIAEAWAEPIVGRALTASGGIKKRHIKAIKKQNERGLELLEGIDAKLGAILRALREK